MKRTTHIRYPWILVIVAIVGVSLVLTACGPGEEEERAEQQEPISVTLGRYELG